MMENTTPMSGWKTKLGAFLIAVAATIKGSAEIFPSPDMIPWINWFSFIVSGVGGAFTVWGIAHKLEKNNKVIVQKKTVPYYVHPMSPEEFKLLERIRSKPKINPLKPPEPLNKVSL
jgi:hypothetical protein